jgi:GntR family transcriptional regulator, transcriptional repressor for pyruvate dehydrogenase complex
MTENIQQLKLSIDRSEKHTDIPTLVVRQITSHIINGALLPGDKLPSELEMTRRFGISRISLREAMKLLEAKGYIESKGRKGKFVRTITGEALETPLSEYIASSEGNFSQLLEVVKIIGGEVASMATSMSSENDIMDLWCELALIESNVRRGGKNQTDAILSHYTQFFVKLSQTAHNKVLSHLVMSISSILKQNLSILYSDIQNKKGKESDLLSHLSAIVGAIEKRSESEAKSAVYQHIDFLKSKISI